MVQHAGKANIAKIAQKLEGQKRSVVAPFDFLTPEFRSSFRCAQLLRKWSGTDLGTHFGKNLARLGNVAKIGLKWGLENMELDGFWIVVAPFGLGLAVVRGTGPKFHYRSLFGHIGPPGAQNGSFSCFWVTSGFWPLPGLLSLGPLGPIGPCLGSYAGVITTLVPSWPQAQASLVGGHQ